jgi:hypothetical protein
MAQKPPPDVKICSTSQLLPRFFMEPESSLLCSKEPTTVFYPEPDHSLRFVLILPFHLRLGLPSYVPFSSFGQNVVCIFSLLSYFEKIE